MKLSFSLHGVVCELDADRAGFLQYVHRNLDGMLGDGALDDSSRRLAAEGGGAQVKTRLYWDQDPPQRWKQAGHRWGRRLLQDGERILQTEVAGLPGLQLEAAWEAEPGASLETGSNPCGMLRLNAYYRPHSRLARLGQQLDSVRSRLYSALGYYLVYFPLIYVLEQTRGRHLLHAAAVSQPGGGWILAGLPGSGKSTFALSLLYDPQAQLLSDNLVLFDEQHVYACPETIHLGDSSRQLLSQRVRDLLLHTGRQFSYNRQEHRLLPEARAWQTHPQGLIFLGLADEFHTRRLSLDAALARLLAFDRMAREMDAYSQFAAALEPIAPQGDSFSRHLEALKALLAPIPRLEFWLKQGSDLQEAALFLRRALAEAAG